MRVDPRIALEIPDDEGVLNIIVYGTPIAALYATNQNRHYLKPHAKEWRQMVTQACGHAWAGRKLIDGPVILNLRFYLPRPKSHYGTRGLRPSAPAYPTTKPDILKLARNVEDALTGIVIRDDAQVINQLIGKRYGEPSRVEIILMKGDP